MESRVTPKQEEMFFRQQATLDALNSLVSTDKLVIYCGAGVTIDQTGVSWSQLVGQVFRVSLGAVKDKKNVKFKSVEYLLSVLDDPRQSASIVAEAFRTGSVAENDWLKAALLQILYTKSSWSTGQILRNVARYAIMAAMFGRDVTIITTNYDAYIEDEIELRYDGLLEELGFPAGRVPGIYRTIHAPDEKSKRRDIRKSKGDAGEIELIYLHGRINRKGQTEGVLVLTEDSYAKTREMSRRLLDSHFRRSDKDTSSKAVLIVGASLTDGPLIDALASTHERTTPTGASPQIRLALTDLPISIADMSASFDSEIDVKIDAGNVRDGLALRGKHIGVEVLWPASHSQTAQFLEEMRVDISGRNRHNRSDAYVAGDLGISYAHRLKRWETEFATSRTMTDQGFVHDHLSVMNEAIKVELKHHRLDPASEILRLELWARTRPSTRRMVLIGNSTGPLLDRAALRSEEVDSTFNASVAAFLEGRPLLQSIENIDPNLTDNRWQTFLSVPIFVHVESDNDNGGGRVPAGVITLASTLSTTHEVRGIWSVFRELGNPELERIKSDLLIPAGKGLLSPERAAELWEDYDEGRLNRAMAKALAIEERARRREAHGTTLD
jgi:hypothetical protein